MRKAAPVEAVHVLHNATVYHAAAGERPGASSRLRGGGRTGSGGDEPSRRSGDAPLVPDRVSAAVSSMTAGRRRRKRRRLRRERAQARAVEKRSRSHPADAADGAESAEGTRGRKGKRKGRIRRGLTGVRRGLTGVGGYGGRKAAGLANRTSAQYAAGGHDEDAIERRIQGRASDFARRGVARTARTAGRATVKGVKAGYRATRRVAGRAASVASAVARTAARAVAGAVGAVAASATAAVSAPLLGAILIAVSFVAVISLFVGGASSSAVCTGGQVAAYLAWARSVADDDSHGYSQTHRDGPDYDCSSLVYYALKAAGYAVPVGAWNTTGAAAALPGLGFERLDYDPGALREGDIVWSDAHMEFYAGDGEYIGARQDEDGGIDGPRTGDQTGREVAVYDAAPGGMSAIWRPSSVDGGCSSSVGTSVGSLDPGLVMKDDLLADMAATGTESDTRYPYGQCTWWAASRRAQIGRPIGGWGNAKDWRADAAAAGFEVDSDARVGDVIVFQPGVLGADGTYGHVAVVERIDGDGGMLISESNAVGLGVVSVRTFTKAQLDAAAGGISFIH